jgi:hypothetical protein
MTMVTERAQYSEEGEPCSLLGEQLQCKRTPCSEPRGTATAHHLLTSNTLTYITITTRLFLLAQLQVSSSGRHAVASASEVESFLGSPQPLPATCPDPNLTKLSVPFLLPTPAFFLLHNYSRLPSTFTFQTFHR